MANIKNRSEEISVCLSIFHDLTEFASNVLIVALWQSYLCLHSRFNPVTKLKTMILLKFYFLYLSGPLNCVSRGSIWYVTHFGSYFSAVLYDDVLCSMQKLLHSKGCYFRGLLYSIKCYIACYMQILYSTSACCITLHTAFVMALNIACYIAELVFNPRQIHHQRPGFVACSNLPLASPCDVSECLHPSCKRQSWLPSAAAQHQRQ